MARAVTHLSRSTPKPATKQCQNRQQCRRTTATSHQQCTQVVVASASAHRAVGATSSTRRPFLGRGTLYALTPLLTGREPIAGSWMHMRGVRRDVFVPSFSAGPLVSFAVGDRRGIGFAARAHHPAVGSFGRLRGSVVVV